MASGPAAPGTEGTRSGADRPARIDVRRDAPEAHRALAALTRAAAIDHRLGELVKVRASQINGCAYCVDQHTAAARRAGEEERRLHLLALWREAPVFDARERAALGLTEALTRLTDGPLPEEALAEAARRFDPPELAALVVAITAINAWNPGLPGRPAHAAPGAIGRLRDEGPLVSMRCQSPL